MFQFQEFKNGIVYQGDCLDIIDSVKNFDHVLTDPPYGITNCDWDIVVDPIKLFNLLLRSKKNSNMVVFGNEPFSTKLRYPNLDLYKYDLIWEKSNLTGFIHSKNMPLRKFENIMIFSTGSIGHENLIKENRMVYNPQGIVSTESKYRKTSCSKMSDVSNGKRPSNRDTVSTTKNYPNNILFYEREKDIMHPTQKPVCLLQYLISTYTNENNTILDPFLGSGTTAIATININRSTGSNRKFIGIELDNEYFDMACKRIDKHESEYLY